MVALTHCPATGGQLSLIIVAGKIFKAACLSVQKTSS